MPSELQIPATVELLWGWCGPAVDDDGELFAWMHETSQGEGWEHNEPATRDDIAVAIRESSISLDLARSEVAHRVRDVLVATLHKLPRAVSFLDRHQLRAVWLERERLRERMSDPTDTPAWLGEPEVDAELLALASAAIDRMVAHAALRAKMSPEEMAEDDRKQLEAQVNWIRHGPGGD